MVLFPIVIMLCYNINARQCALSLDILFLIGEACCIKNCSFRGHKQPLSTTSCIIEFVATNSWQNSVSAIDGGSITRERRPRPGCKHGRTHSSLQLCCVKESHYVMEDIYDHAVNFNFWNFVLYREILREFCANTAAKVCLIWQKNYTIHNTNCVERTLQCHKSVMMQLNKETSNPWVKYFYCILSIKYEVSVDKCVISKIYKNFPCILNNDLRNTNKCTDKALHIKTSVVLFKKYIIKTHRYKNYIWLLAIYTS